MTQTDLFCLKWNNHNSNIANVISSLFSEGRFCDVTLGAEGQFLQAHRLVLIACSDYFQNLLNPVLSNQHPIFIMEGIKFADLKAIIEYIYFGEVSIDQNQLRSVLKSSQTLRVKSLGDVSDQLKGFSSSPVSVPKPPKSLKRNMRSTKDDESVLGVKSVKQKKDDDSGKSFKTVTLSDDVENNEMYQNNVLYDAKPQEEGVLVAVAPDDPVVVTLDNNMANPDDDDMDNAAVKLELGSRTAGPMLSSLPLSPGKVSGPTSGPAFRKKQSRVWSYYEKVNDGLEVECSLCGEKQRYAGNTTNMTRHIEKKHLTVQDDKTVVAAAGDKMEQSDEGFRRKNFTTKRKCAIRSPVWQYFVQDPMSKKVQCKLCMNSYAFCNNTTNLHLHLKTKHSEVAENMKNLPFVLPGDEEECETVGQDMVVTVGQDTATVEYYLEGGEPTELVSVETCDDRQLDTTAVYVVREDGQCVPGSYPV